MQSQCFIRATVTTFCNGGWWYLQERIWDLGCTIPPSYLSDFLSAVEPQKPLPTAGKSPLPPESLPPPGVCLRPGLRWLLRAQRWAGWGLLSIHRRPGTSQQSVGRKGTNIPADPVTTHPASPKTGLLFSDRTNVITHRTPFHSLSVCLGCSGSSPLHVGFLQLWCAGMWDLPRSGIKPVSPSLIGRLLTTGPPGKSPYPPHS